MKVKVRRIWWHCAKAWYHIDSLLALKNIAHNTPVKCEYDGNTYEYNMSIKNPKFSEEMLLYGDWYVYTWSD